MAEVTDNPTRSRFELDVEGSVAFVDYARDANRLVLVHTEVPAALAGKGVGSALAKGVLDEARRRGFTVAPQCAFMASYIDRHPAYRDLLVPGR